MPPLVDIITQSPGQSSEEIERYITVPIEVQMAGMPYVQAIRTISLFGLSDVKVQFTYDFTYQEASQLVINRLSQLGTLPNGVQPVLSPTSPIGEIFRYRVVGPPGYSVTDLKTIQDWILQRRFKAIPGVIDVTGWGGKTKTYDITIDLDRLLAYGLTLKQVLRRAEQRQHQCRRQHGEHRLAVGDRALRSARSARWTTSATPCCPRRTARRCWSRDVATVSVGHQPRLGHRRPERRQRHRAGHRADAARREDPADLQKRAGEVDKINAPASCRPACRSSASTTGGALVGMTTHTVLHNLVVGIVLIFLIQWLFLGDLRSAADRVGHHPASRCCSR